MTTQREPTPQVIDGTGDGGVFGYAFLPALLSLVTRTIATSVARYRAVAT